ncbi:AdoMet-dependent rRNA methyltransferase spb1 [Babesia sp. Xinjiang]|uniref:AdoMet-dependent rRNA methyltransferase spb1 n=1 Tax=Babesia sp. Xinjiang TaxID=462227 RepID=UPI000A255C2D|nr:AdoMet-dependent rRNA methyltransferase spb1 [Babesia sp. Xinjiang]ORM39958.1 AdoMet-dependent rRNA methyltransferase spb1 [Babesia sp. Xinjiang]
MAVSWYSVFAAIPPYFWGYLGVFLSLGLSVLGSACYSSNGVTDRLYGDIYIFFRGILLCGPSIMGGSVKAPRITVKNLVSVIFCEAVGIYGLIVSVLLINAAMQFTFTPRPENFDTDVKVTVEYFVEVYRGYALFAVGLAAGLCNLFCGSADYNSLIWTLGKCFERVKVTKPSSSRNVSAEIFAVCIGFRTLKALDPKLFNCDHVFISQGKAEEDDADQETSKVTSLNQLLRQRKKVNKQGYEEGDDFREHSVLDFLTTDNPPQMLISTHRFVFKPRNTDDVESAEKDAALLKAVDNSPLTTEEIRLLCSDLKVAGRSDLQHLLKWRQKLRREFLSDTKEPVAPKAVVDKEDDGEDDKGDSEDALRMQQLEVADRLRKDRRRAERKKRRALMKHKKAMAGNSVILDTDPSMFRLSVLKGLDIDELDDDSDDSASDTPKHVAQGTGQPGDHVYDDSEVERYDSDSGDSMELEFETDDEDDKVLNMEIDLELNHEMSKLAEAERKKSAKKLTRRQRVNAERGAELSSLLESMQYEARLKAQQELQESEDEAKSDSSDDDNDSGDVSSAGSDDEVSEPSQSVDKPSSSKSDVNSKRAMEDAMVDRWFDQDVFHDQPRETARKQKKKESKTVKGSKKEPTFTVVPAVSDADTVDRVRNAVEVELSRDKDTIAEVQAMGSLLINKDTRMAVIDGAYNRRTFDDGDLPSWFEADEKKHSNYELPVTKELMKRYKAKLYELKNRPIRKVLEARGRRKLRVERKLKSILPRVEALQNSETASASTARKLLRKVKHTASNKRDKVYVVSRRGGSTSTSSGGSKGSRKVTKAVDKRMKKDNVRQKRKPKSRSHLFGRIPSSADGSSGVVDSGESNTEKNNYNEVSFDDIGDDFFLDPSSAACASDQVLESEPVEPSTPPSAAQAARIAELETEVRLLRAQNAQLIVNSCALYNTLMQHIEKLRSASKERSATTKPSVDTPSVPSSARSSRRK